MKLLLILILTPALLFLTACPGTPPETAVINQISVEQASRAVIGDKAQFIDVRTIEEYESGHAPQALNLPLDDLENELGKLDKNKPVYLICQTGGRSQKGAETLQKAGFTEIYNVRGGTSAWAAAELPIEK